MNKDEFEKLTQKLYNADTHTSPDFQCEQTGGFPTSLCVNWEKEKAWLALNYSFVKSEDDVSEYEKLCADFGIRDCPDEEIFNQILKTLGEDAYENAALPIEEDQGMEL